MSQITTPKINILSSKKTPSKTALPIKKDKKSIAQILEMMRTSREPPQIKDPFINLKKLKVEPKMTEKDHEREKKRQEKLLALLIKDIMKG